jgi:hypothetical protein
LQKKLSLSINQQKLDWHKAGEFANPDNGIESQ